MTREEAINDLKTLKDFFIEQSNATPLCLDYAIEELERKHGEWLYLYDGNYKCSVCGSWWCCTDSQIDEMNFCPNCGVMMSESLKVHEIGKSLVDGIQAGIKGEKDG